MKKLLSLFSVLAILLSVVLCFFSCNKLPSDYVKGDNVIVDNETPFVYDESTVKIICEKGTVLEYDIERYVHWACDYLDGPLKYKQIASLYGNKILRHYTDEDTDIYYTVYSLPDNHLFYLNCYYEDGEYYLDKRYYFAHNWAYDIRTDLSGYVYDKDTPSAILGDKLPARCYLDYYSPEEIADANANVMEEYLYHCDMAGLSSSPYFSDYCTELYDKAMYYEIESTVRCIEYISFDLSGSSGGHGVYVYDIYRFKDGTGLLKFYHFKAKSPRYTLIQTEEIELSFEEIKGLKDTFKIWDFDNIPTWNPEGFWGCDGETSYIRVENNSMSSKLISMWEPTDRYGIYHISRAIEDLVRNHVTVNEGRIFNKENK